MRTHGSRKKGRMMSIYRRTNDDYPVYRNQASIEKSTVYSACFNETMSTRFNFICVITLYEYPCIKLIERYSWFLSMLNKQFQIVYTSLFMTDLNYHFLPIIIK